MTEKEESELDKAIMDLCKLFEELEPIPKRKMFIHISIGFLEKMNDDEFISFIKDDDIEKQCNSDCYDYVSKRYNLINKK